MLVYCASCSNFQDCITCHSDYLIKALVFVSSTSVCFRVEESFVLQSHEQLVLGQFEFGLPGLVHFLHVLLQLKLLIVVGFSLLLNQIPQLRVQVGHALRFVRLYLHLLLAVHELDGALFDLLAELLDCLLQLVQLSALVSLLVLQL